MFAKAAFLDAGRDYCFVLGDLTALHLALSLLPIVRNSIWMWIFGTILCLNDNFLKITSLLYSFYAF